MLIHIVEVVPGRCEQCGDESDTYIAGSLQEGFQDVRLRVHQCAHCGFRQSVVDESGAPGPTGRAVTLEVASQADLARDIVKSTTATVSIPDIGLQADVEGSRFCSVKSMLEEIYATLSAPSGLTPERLDMLDELQQYIDGDAPFSIVLDDPMGRSLVSAADADTLSVRTYDRSSAANDRSAA